MRVLVLDDDDAVGRTAVRMAALAGFEADAVTEAAAFVSRLHSDPPDIVLLDLQLGDTDGIEQLRVLAACKFAGAVVLMSGFDGRVLSSARTVAESLGLRVAGAVEKPLRLDVLETTLSRLRCGDDAITLPRLQQAIARNELMLEFQPIVTRAPRLQKLEALVRWNHPRHGRLPPARFLPMAEADIACIDALTVWVLGAAIDAYATLAARGITVPISVNISPHNLHDLTLPDIIDRRMREHGMPAGMLHIEVTETAALANTANSLDVLSRLRLKGMPLSIDDFGTGYASLKLLQQMPYSEIKIDRYFVAAMAESRDAASIVRSIVDLAANIGMNCVAEGVETDAVAILLEEMGVSCLQGELISQPLPVESIPGWLARWQNAPGPPAPAPLQDGAGGSVPLAGVKAIRPSAVILSHAGGAKGIKLPPRQMQVMRLLAKGCSIKDIARRLDLGVGTVKVHLSLAYTALGTRNRIEAIQRLGPLMEEAEDDPEMGEPRRLRDTTLVDAAAL
jgi:EAL domain-containing protein (putative c-di-GMP-specific phosphodiesterase class I)/FixJ family two-component response regulator